MPEPYGVTDLIQQFLGAFPISDLRLVFASWGLSVYTIPSLTRILLYSFCCVGASPLGGRYYRLTPQQGALYLMFRTLRCGQAEVFQG